MKDNVAIGPAYARLSFDAVADAAAVVVAGNARFTVLTPRLIRLEYSPDGRFEDRPSQVFWYRNQPVPPFEARREEDGVRLWVHIAYGPGAAHAFSSSFAARASADTPEAKRRSASFRNGPCMRSAR